MKKVLVFLAVLSITSLCLAQPEVGSTTVQPKLGINVANMTQGEGSDPRIGFVGGIELQSQASKLLGFSYGILYSMQGSKDKDYNSNLTETLKIDYLNVPILANVYLYKGLAIKAGIQPGFNVIDKYKLSGGGQSLTGNLSDINVEVKSFDFGIPFGISYEYNNVVLDARYILGMTKFIDKQDVNSRHRVFQFTLGYRFSR